MPKTTMHKHDFLASAKDDIGTSRKSRVVQPVPETESA